MTDISPTQLATSSHPLVRRIAALRGRVRLILGLFGAGVVLAVAVEGIFLLILSDYFLHIPATGRLLLLLAWIACNSLLFWKFLLAPLSTRLTDQFLASRVENLHKDLSDELISAVHFIHAGTTERNALAARHVDAAAQKVQSIRFEDAVDFRRPGKSLGIAALIIIIVAAVAGMNPTLAKIGLSRWFSASPIPWPRLTTVGFAWSTPDGQPPAVLPVGEQFVIRAKVTTGGYPRQRVWLTIASPAGTGTQLMTYQQNMSTPAEQVYEHTLAPDREGTLELRLEAGDDDEEQPVRIRLAPRPVVNSLTASITPPPYVTDLKDPTKPAPPVNVDLLSAAGRAVQGAKIELHVRATKPLGLDNKLPRVTLLDQYKDVPLPLAYDRSLDSPGHAVLALLAREKIEARASIVDVDGFDNRIGGAFSIDVVPDALPSVAMTEPRASVTCTPNALIKIAIQASDDLGLDGLKLVARKFDAKDSDLDLVNTDLSWLDRIADTAVGTTTGHAAYQWDLTSLKLAPGSRYTFYAMVQDNYFVHGKRHDWVKSTPLSLQIRTEAEIQKDARNRLNEIKERIKNLKVQQDQTKALTEAVQSAIDKAGASNSTQRAQLADLAQTQSQEAATAASIAQRAQQVQTDLVQSRMGETEMGKLAGAVAQGMKDVGATNMPNAAGDLKSASDTPPDKGKQAAESAKQAAGEQTQAIAKMDALINELGAAGDFQAALAELRNIQEKQLQTDRETRDISTKTLGRNPNDLPPDLKNRIERNADDQKALANRTSEWMSNADKTAQQLQQSDPASSESLSKAAQAGNDLIVPPSQSGASKSISENKMSDASNQQTSADRGLQAMMDELNQNERRQLEELARQLRSLIDELEQRKSIEVAIHKETDDAGPKATVAALTPLSNRQGQNQMNTIITQKKAENTRNAQVALPDIKEAVSQMAAAAGQLLSPNQPNSLTAEQAAVDALDSAIEKLKKERDKVESQLKEKQLDAFIKQYEAIRKDQTDIKTGSDDIEKNRLAAPDKQIDRRAQIALGGMVTRQNGLISQVDSLSLDKELSKFEVVVWMNNQVTDSMKDSSDRMKKTTLGTPLASVQQTAIDQLTAIIEALKEEKKREAEFRQQGGGGGGGGRPPLVPPLAQLKMLKAMQGIVNTRTVTLNKSLENAPETEKPGLQRESSTLGKKQTEIKGITEKMLKQLSQ